MAIVMSVSCSEVPPKDSCCNYTNLTPEVTVEDGQGAIQVDGSTSASYYLLDEKGEVLKYQSLNKPLGVDPGRYTVKVNNSTHDVEVRADELVRCATGTLIVTGLTSEHYSVIDSSGVQLGYQTLGKAMSFFPGLLRVNVNETEVFASVKLKELTEIRTGSLIVHGATGEYYYVLDKGNKQLNYNTLESPLAFLPGSYVVKVNNTSMEADVTAGTVTKLSTGSVVVKGLTEEYYYVTDAEGNALNYQTLNKPLAFFPGALRIKLNNTQVNADVIAGQTTEFATGSLLLTGVGTGYYYVLDHLGNQLNYNSLNKSLSFFPSEYTIKLGTSTRKATVQAGELTSVSAFN